MAETEKSIKPLTKQNKNRYRYGTPIMGLKIPCRKEGIGGSFVNLPRIIIELTNEWKGIYLGTIEQLSIE